MLPPDEAHTPSPETPADDDTASEPSFVEATMAMTDAAKTFGASMKRTVRVAERSFRQAAHERPYLLLGAAAGGGFVVGGGLASPITRSLLGMGMRTAGAFLLDAAIQTLTPPGEVPDQASGTTTAPASEADDTPSATAARSAADDFPEDQRRPTSSKDSSSTTNVTSGVPHAPHAP